MFVNKGAKWLVKNNDSKFIADFLKVRILPILIFLKGLIFYKMLHNDFIPFLLTSRPRKNYR